MHQTLVQRKSAELLNHSQNAKEGNQKQDNLLINSRSIENAQQMPGGIELAKNTINNNNNSNRHQKLNKKQFMKSVNVPKNTGLKWGVNNNHAMKRIQRLYTQMPISSTNLQTQARFNNAVKNNRSLVPRQNYNRTSINMEKDIKNKSFAKQLFNITKDSPDKKLSAFNKKHPPYGTKEGLYEQNLKLKNTINQLKGQLLNQKMSVEVEKRKNKKYTKRLNRQFKKQFYYSHQNRDVDIEVQQAQQISDAEDQENVIKIYQNNELGHGKGEINAREGQNLPGSKQYRYLERPSMNSIQYEQGFAHSQQYMIAGIKQKHEQLQLQHEKLVKELHAIKATDGRKKLQEISVYCLVLQQSNRKLATGIQVCNEKLLAYERKQEKDDEAYNNAVVYELSQKIEILRFKNSNLQQQNKQLRLQRKENAKVIQYLEQLVISKENLQYKSANSLKKLAKILNSLQVQLSEQREYNKNLKETYLKQLEDAVSHSKEKQQKLKQIFEQALMQKNAQLKKQQKEMKYMATIIQNWKLQETKYDRQGSDNLLNKQQRNDSKKSIKNEKKIDQSGPVKKITQRIELQKKYQQKIGQVASLTNRTQIQPESLTKNIAQKNDTQALRPAGERKRKTAGVKYSQNCKKMRKVSIEQISQLAQYIRYRMIGSNIKLDQVCKYLDYRPLETDPNMVDDGSDEIQRWKKLYISQADLVAVLVQEPFKLKPQDAMNLARYIIEDECFYQNGDQNNGFVYVNFENEMERNIAKSILKAFVQTHSNNFLESEDTKISQYHICQKQWIKVLAQKGAKINTPLISIASSGFISKQRWNELLKSINIELSQNLMEWCIGRMIMESEGLSKLKYRAIIPEEI